MGPTLESILYKGFYTTLALLLNGIFNCFQQILMTGSNLSCSGRKTGEQINIEIDIDTGRYRQTHRHKHIWSLPHLICISLMVVLLDSFKTALFVLVT